MSNALQFFVGEKPPLRPGRDRNRMFLDELDAESRKLILDFFKANCDEIVSDLFAGDGEHAAGWFMAAYKATAQTRWRLITDKEAAKFLVTARSNHLTRQPKNRPHHHAAKRRRRRPAHCENASV